MKNREEIKEQVTECYARLLDARKALIKARRLIDSEHEQVGRMTIMKKKLDSIIEHGENLFEGLKKAE